MNYRTHVSIGLIASAGVSILIPANTLAIHQKLLMCGTSIIGSLIPDVDHPNSKLSKTFPLTSNILYSYFISAGTYFGDRNYFSSLSEHRGICHSYTACIIAVLPLLFFISWQNYTGWHIILGLFIGIFFHILADSTTQYGVMWLAPFSTKRLPTQKRYYSISRCYCKTQECYILAMCLYISNLLSCTMNTLLLIQTIFLFMSFVPLIAFVSDVKSWNDLLTSSALHNLIHYIIVDLVLLLLLYINKEFKIKISTLMWQVSTDNFKKANV